MPQRPSPFTITVVNNTIVSNTAQYGGGIHGNSANLYLANNIVYGNTASTSGDDLYLIQSSAYATVAYNDIGDGQYNGTNGNFSADPLFVAPSLEDFHLQHESPCVDKGTGTGAPTSDFEGDSRPIGAGVDVGADEVKGPDLSASSKACAATDEALQSGATLTYTIVIHNSDPTSAQVRMTDTIPAYTSYISPSLTSTAGEMTYTGNLTDTGTIVWSGTVTGNTPVTITFQVELLPSATSNLPIRNTAYIDNGWGTVYSRSTAMLPYKAYLPMIVKEN